MTLSIEIQRISSGMTEAKSSFNAWNPVPDLPEEFFIEANYDDYEGFRVLCRGREPDDRMFRIQCDYMRSYRVTEEGSFLKYERNEVKPLRTYGLFLIENSEYLDWFKIADQGINGDVKHYAIYCPNQCIDILSKREPIVEWL